MSPNIVRPFIQLCSRIKDTRQFTQTNVVLSLSIFTRDSISLYAIARICYRPSARLSVTWVYHRKTVEVRIMKFSPYGSLDPLVFLRDKFHPEILMGSPRAGVSNKGEVGKISSF